MTLIRNKVILIGKIDTPTITTTESNLKVADFRVFTYEPHFNKEGERHQETMMHRCRAHGKLADIIERNSTRGLEVAVEGILITSSYKYRGHTIPQNYIQVNELLILTKQNK